MKWLLFVLLYCSLGVFLDGFTIEKLYGFLSVLFLVGPIMGIMAFWKAGEN